MKKGIIFTSIAGILIALIVFRIINGNNSQMKPGAGNPGGGKPVGVTAIVTKAENLEDKIFSTGTILPNEQVELRSEIAGRVVGIYFKEDSPVTKGQLLVKINDRDYKAQLEKINIQIKLATDDEYRKRKLVEIKGISQDEYDRALTTLNSLKADASLLEAQIAKTEIYAPFNGIIGLRHISEGGYISSATLIAHVQEVNPVKIEFSIPEKYSSLVRKNSKINFTVTGSERVYNGTVYAISSMIDENTRSLTVRAIAQNPDRSLTPGAFVKIDFSLTNINEALLVPAEAIVPDMSGQKVFVVRGDTARSVKVDVGIRTEREVQIVKGLNFNDTIIISGLLQIRDKSKVQVKQVVDKSTLKVAAKTN